MKYVISTIDEEFQKSRTPGAKDKKKRKKKVFNAYEAVHDRTTGLDLRSTGQLIEMQKELSKLLKKWKGDKPVTNLYTNVWNSISNEMSRRIERGED